MHDTPTLIVELVFVVMPVLDMYLDGCRGMCGESSAVKWSGRCLRLAPARHALINIAATEAV